MIVEYLVIFRKNGSFCDSVAGLNRLLQVDSAITIDGSTVRHKNGFSCNYQATTGEVAGREQRYFQLRFSYNSGTTNPSNSIELFSEPLKSARRAISKAEGQIETLRDDISSHYAHATYPLIHEIEIMMRQLIANFMLITLGREWAKETSPNDFEETLRKSKRKDQGHLNILHSVDFIDLGDFLFTPYSKRTIQDLYINIDKAKEPSDLANLKEFIPQSNWKRYFSALVDCEDSYLDSRWKELYEIRCKVAHNASISRSDHSRAAHLIGEVKPKLEDAIRKLSNVSIPPDEKDSVAESAVKSADSASWEFIKTWKAVEWAVDIICSNAGITKPTSLPTAALKQRGILNDEQAAIYSDLRKFRNDLVHGPSTGHSTELLQDISRAANILLKSLQASIDTSSK
ncbi:hypothetical protein COCOR_04665 [Corallococcus coralloides DSM 2259]|uniref:Uncharacterized protein n=1 Tax=Corallococcus coralloides (strain ATCC 25202 / DSM 2259 / NBRC 100086 / M2) TaxID=1144275 RepID=H8MJD5_CORCM|nr:HEPN domain-containing protein [Corallococcus coralloides]AFE05953.1 hypothetical protein COCOR_04665 [Corallococcus coralloides DSM 2259]